EFIAKVVDYVEGVVGDIGDNRRKVFFFFGQVAEINGVAALALALIGDFQDRETLVVSGVYVFEAVGIFLVLVNEFVGGLRRAENVVIDALGVVFRRELVAGYRGFEGAIEKAVAGPGIAGELDPFQIVSDDFPCSDFNDVRFLPVRASNGDAVRGIAAVAGNIEGDEARGAVGGELVGIEKHFGRALETLLHVHNILVLQAVILGEEKIFAFAKRRRVFREVEELLETLPHLRAIGNFFEVAEGNFVFCFDPAGGFRRIIVLQPAIRIGDLSAVIIVNLIVFARLRVLEILRERHGGEKHTGEYGENRAQIKQEVGSGHGASLSRKLAR